MGKKNKNNVQEIKEKYNVTATHVLDAIVYPRLFPPRNIDIANVLHVK